MFEGMNALQGFGIGGTGALVLMLLTFLGNSYWKKRSETREDTKSERSSESGIVETTASAMKIIREQMETMRADMKEMEIENKELDRRVDELETSERMLNRKVEDQDLKLESQGRRIKELEKENRLLKSLGS